MARVGTSTSLLTFRGPVGYSQFMRVRGFILQPTYRVEGGNPVVHLYGRLEDGRTFLVRDGRQAPHFYLRSSDAGRARGLGAAPLADTDRKTLRGEPVCRVEVPIPAWTPPLRNRLMAAGIPCFEADVRFAMRYLIDRKIRGCLEIEGEGRPGMGVDLVLDDPAVRPASLVPDLSLLSLDIETDPDARRVLSVALYGCGAEEVLLLTPEGMSCPPPAVALRNEGELLRALADRIQALDPDIITGWNVVDFDLAVLLRAAHRKGTELGLGRGPGGLRLLQSATGRGSSRASVVGRVVLDGLALLRGSFIPMARYSLDFVAREVLGRGKSMSGADRGEEILHAFHHERERFVEYNLNDARLAWEILDELRLVELAVERSRLTGMPLDRVSASVAAFDFLYLSELGPRRRVAPTVGSQEAPRVPMAGGHVLTPEPGLYENVLVFDFKSLYPALIRTFQIDPLGYALAEGDTDAIVAPNGARFRRQEGILTQILDELFARREAAKSSDDRVTSQAIKILMNSFYGVLGTSACRFFNPAVANAITSLGREILLWSKEQVEARRLRVLYGDTDSLFVASGLADEGEARRLGDELVEELNRSLRLHIREKWRVESRLELEFETLYLHLFLPPIRHGVGGARKRYVGLVEERGSRHVVFTGMEVVRRDWTDLAKTVQRELYERLFSKRPVAEYLAELVDRVRKGQLDSSLTYRKALRKDLAAYTETTPPHVLAARKSSRPPGRLISYVMTVVGPELKSERSHPLDYEHYVQKQVRPVAEPVLAQLGLDFATVIGDNRQLSLF